MSVILYTTHCPQCIVLEHLLKQNNVLFQTVTDMDIMRDKKILSVPQLEVNGTLKNMQESMRWLNTLREEHNNC